MENPAIYLWIPIIIVVILSVIKLINKGGPKGKPWIRIEKVKDNEKPLIDAIWKSSAPGVNI